jgi:tight adherence protein C
MVLALLIAIGLTLWYFIIVYKHHNWLNKIFDIYDFELFHEDETLSQSKFKLKLLQAGLTKKEFNEVVFASIVAGVALFSLIFILKPSFVMEIMIGFIAIVIALFTPYVYLQEQRNARIKRIDLDLPVFIDLLIIILEGGGGLNNAIDEVTTQAGNVIGKDLIGESKRFKYELITYGSSIAFDNLVIRTGSEAVATIVGYMKLSEETGIGVKTIFENQAQEIRSAQSITVKKSAAMMNIYITFTMFLFILPAIIAMIVFPLTAGALMKLF